MLLLRRFEEKASQLYGIGLIGGFCHLYIGQEAVVTGVQYALEPGDSVITGYRCHAHMLIAGVPPKEVMAELTGRAAGASKGKGGSMHLFAPERGFYGGHGIVARPGAASASASDSPTSTAPRTGFPSPTSATGRPIRARCSKPSTWRRSGSSPSSS